MLRIYTTATCGYCHHAKAFMHERGIPYEEIRVDEDRERALEMVQMTGQMGVPVVASDEQYLVGFDPQGILHLAGMHSTT